MDLVKFNNKVEEFFNGINLKSKADIIDHEGIKFAEVVAFAIIKGLDNREVQIRCLAYENDTTQVTISLGAADITPEVMQLFQKFNVSNFGFKALSEYKEIRLYNQAFFETPESYLYNFDRLLGVFLNEQVQALIKPMLPYLKNKI